MRHRTNAPELYYSATQQLAHHAASGCLMSVGDLMRSGTISGAVKESRGSLLELTWGGTEPLLLAPGKDRQFLQDGNRVTLRGHAQGHGYWIGFGDCVGAMYAPSRPH
jgi:fumarylacetoacetase